MLKQALTLTHTCTATQEITVVIYIDKYTDMLKTNHCSESECIHDGYEQINQSSGTSAASYRVRDYRLVADRTRLLYASLKKKSIVWVEFIFF